MLDKNSNGNSLADAQKDVPEHIAKCVNLKSFSALLIKETDALGLILKGHHGVESLLNASLIEALDESDALELSRITFLLKADLLIALGLLPKERRPLFNRLNTYRNKFAHDPHYIIDETFSEETSRLLLSLAPEPVTTEFLCNPDEGIRFIPERRVVFICWATCIHMLSAACKKKISSKVTERAIATMAEKGDFKDPEGLSNHWRQCEAEILKEHYPTFFSQWPTHIDPKEKIDKES